MDEIPLERMGVVIRLEKAVNEEIGVDDLAAAKPKIEPGDIVAIDTGWSGRWRTPEWTGIHIFRLKPPNGWLIRRLSWLR